jgi:hypothetical protein
MKYALCGLMAACCLAVPSPAFAGTFFLYLEETCDGEHGVLLAGARLGIIDTFFENGQILFDDVADQGRGTRVKTRDVVRPLAVARRGGAEYLLAVAIDSLVEKTSSEPKAPENIKSTCTFLLYEVGTGRLLTEGSLAMEKKGLKDEKERDDLGFELGHKISMTLDNFF